MCFRNWIFLSGSLLQITLGILFSGLFGWLFGLFKMFCHKQIYYTIVSNKFVEIFFNYSFLFFLLNSNKIGFSISCTFMGKHKLTELFANYYLSICFAFFFHFHLWFLRICYIYFLI